MPKMVVPREQADKENLRMVRAATSGNKPASVGLTGGRVERRELVSSCAGNVFTVRGHPFLQKPPGSPSRFFPRQARLLVGWALFGSDLCVEEMCPARYLRWGLGYTLQVGDMVSADLNSFVRHMHP